MSKRGAGDYMARMPNGEVVNESNGGPGDRPQTATAAQLAARKMAKPKGRPRSVAPGESTPLFAPIPPSNGGFSFGASQQSQAPAASFGFGAQPQAQEQGQASFGGFGNTASSNSFNFGASNGTNSGANTPGVGGGAFNFNFGGGQQQTASTPFAFGQSQPAPQTTQTNTPSFMFGQSQPAPAATIPSFSFGATQASTQPAGNLFGGSQSTNQPASNLFGGTPTNSFGAAGPSPVNGAFSSFGGSQQTSREATPQATFGQQPAQTTADASSSLFVPKESAAPKDTPSFTFGAKPVAQPEAPKTNLFGSTNANAPFSFSTGNQAPAATPSFSFGASTSQATPAKLAAEASVLPSTEQPIAQTPAAPPTFKPAASTNGAETPKANPFGSLKRASSPLKNDISNSLFSPPAAQNPAPAQTPAIDLGNSLFKSAATTPAQTSTDFSFNATASATPQQNGSTSLFSQTPATAPPKSLFSTQPAQTPAAPNLFASLNANPSSTPAKPNLFAAQPAATPIAATPSAGHSAAAAQTPATTVKAPTFSFGNTVSSAATPAAASSTLFTPAKPAMGFTSQVNGSSAASQISAPQLTQSSANSGLPPLNPGLIQSISSAAGPASTADQDFSQRTKLAMQALARRRAWEMQSHLDPAQRELHSLRIYANSTRIYSKMGEDAFDYTKAGMKRTGEDIVGERERKRTRLTEGSKFLQVMEVPSDASTMQASPQKSIVPTQGAETVAAPRPTSSLKDLFPASAAPQSATASRLMAAVNNTNSSALFSSNQSQSVKKPAVFAMPAALDPKAMIKSFGRTATKADDLDSDASDDEVEERRDLEKRAARRQVFRNGKFEWEDQESGAGPAKDKAPEALKAKDPEPPKPAETTQPTFKPVESTQPFQPSPSRPFSFGGITQPSSSTTAPPPPAASFIFGNQRSQTASPASSSGGQSVFDQPQSDRDKSAVTNIFASLGSTSASAAGTPGQDESSSDEDSPVRSKTSSEAVAVSTQPASVSVASAGQSEASTPRQGGLFGASFSPAPSAPTGGSLFSRITPRDPPTTNGQDTTATGFGLSAATAAPTNGSQVQNGVLETPKPAKSLFSFAAASSTPAAQPAASSLFSFTPLAKPPILTSEGATPAPAFKFNLAAPSRPDTPASGLSTTDTESKADEDSEFSKDTQTDLMNLDALKENKTILFEVAECTAKALKDGKWATQGVGPLLLTKDNTKGDVFLSMKIRPSGKFLLHMKILPIGEYKLIGKKSVVAPVTKPGGSSIEQFVFSLDNAELAKEFMDLGNELKKGNA